MLAFSNKCFDRCGFLKVPEENLVRRLDRRTCQDNLHFRRLSRASSNLLGRREVSTHGSHNSIRHCFYKSFVLSFVHQVFHSSSITFTFIIRLSAIYTTLLPFTHQIYNTNPWKTRVSFLDPNPTRNHYQHASTNPPFRPGSSYPVKSGK